VANLDAPVRRPDSPASRLLWSVISAGLLAALIGYQMGWKWALAGVFGIAVHELGHALLINALGLGPARIEFIAFLGAVTKARLPAPTELKGALIALAGPLFGLLAAIPFFAAAWLTGDQSWAGGALFIALINLVNLLPAPPLDGSKALGPVLSAIHPGLEKLALIVVGAGAAWWALSSGRYLFAGVVALGVAGSVMSKQIRAPSGPLTAEGVFWSLGVYALTAALAVGVLLSASGMAGFGTEFIPVLQRVLA
jgi:Zn-dependent protease